MDCSTYIPREFYSHLDLWKLEWGEKIVTVDNTCTQRG